MPRNQPKELPLWAKQIRAARTKIGASQGDLAQKLFVTPMAISNWELGKSEPGPATYLALGRIVGDPECWVFWERAGLTKSDVARVVPDLEQRIYNRAQPVEIQPAIGAMKEDGTRLKKRPDAVGVPLLKDAAAAGSPRLIEEAEVEDTLIFPRKWCPHPESTTCITVAGDSMSPVLEDGDVVAVDTSIQEPAKLFNEMVAARDPHGAITIKWLRKTETGILLLPQNTSKRHQPVVLDRVGGWKIVGQVLFSFRRYK